MKRLNSDSDSDARKKPNNNINQFRRQYYFLSNYYATALTIEYEGETYKSVEHAYQAAKTDNQEIRLKIKNAPAPGDAKRLGKGIILKEDWDDKKYDIMEKLVRYKFTMNKEMGERLLKTGDVQLIEGNTWGDVYWGVCNGKGQNNLGKILMGVRSELRKSQ
jgi:hypothetical protein